MKETLKKIFLLLITNFSYLLAQDKINYISGEKLDYKISYSFFNAAYASFKVTEELYQNKPHFHMIGTGASGGALSLFCKIDDRYETYIDKENTKPSKFVRKVSECGYKIDVLQFFDFNKKEVYIFNKLNNKNSNFKITDSTQDLISAFYKLRNSNTDNLKNGDFINSEIFLDEELFTFKSKILNREVVKTKFGKVHTIKIRPYVQNGRIFKAQESVTIWISDDKNHVPLKIQADLMVGALKVSLDRYENLKYPINFK